MTSAAPELSTVVARLEKVERQNRRLKMAGIAVLVLAVAGLLMGQAVPRSRTVEGDEFILKDASGKTRARLSSWPSMKGEFQPSLRFYDEGGSRVAEIGVFAGGGEIILNSGLSVTRVVPAQLTMNQGDPATYETISNELNSTGLMFVYGKSRSITTYGNEWLRIDKDGKVIWKAP